MDLLWFLREPSSFFIYIFSETVSALSAVASVFLLSTQFGKGTGISNNQIIFMLGYSLLVDGIYWLFFRGNNMGEISRIIGRGQLDHCMTQPVPLPIQLLTNGFSPVSSSHIFLTGIIVTVYAAHQLKLKISILWLLLLIGYVFLSMFIILSLVYIFSARAFYSPVASEEVAGEILSFTAIKVYPLNGFPKTIQNILLTVLPIGLTAWFPSILLLNAATKETIKLAYGILPVIASMFILIAALLFLGRD
ncbi:ABC-2 family transporter protein [Vagococcus elongatus]